MTPAALALVAIAAGATAAAAAERVPRVLDRPPDGGTTLVLVEDHRAPLVHLVMEFPVGSWSPWARRVHLEEAFAIQLYDPQGKLRARADELAMEIGLSVGDRQSSIEASFLKEDLPAALDLVRDVLRNRDFDPSELGRWGRQRKLLWLASLKQPFFVVVQAVHRELFAPGDPRRIPWEEPDPVSRNLGALARARDIAVGLPGRVIGFAGDLTGEEAERAAAGLLPPLVSEPPRDLEVRFAPVRAAAERRDETVRLPRLTQVYLAYARESLPWTDPDYPAFVVADHVLGGHFYSRLYEALRHEGGETYASWTQSRGDVIVGAYGLGTFTRAPNAARTEEKLRQVLERLHEKGITEEEREAAIGYLRGRRAMDKQSPEAILRRWLSERRLGLPEGFSDRLPDLAAQVSLEEINRFIARWYDPARFFMVRAVPE